MINIWILAVVKNEDRLEEWIDHHINLGFDKIIICINDNPIPKLFYKNLYKKFKDYISLLDFSRVILRESNAKHHVIDRQSLVYKKAMSKITQRLNIKPDWLTIIDADEFIDFKDCDNVKEFIQKHCIDKGFDCCDIRWETYTDSGIIYKKDEGPSLIETYKDICKRTNDNWCEKNDELSWVKCIFKYDDSINLCAHGSHDYIFKKDDNILYNHIDDSIAVIKHYRTRCLEHYINYKIIKNKAYLMEYTKSGEEIFKTFFSVNEITLEKLNYIYNFCENFPNRLSKTDKLFLEQAAQQNDRKL